MAHAKGVVVVSEAQRAVLERLVRAYTTPKHLVERAQIVLMSAEGRLNVAQAGELGIDVQRVRRWRRRWSSAQPALVAAEQAEAGGADIEDLVLELLSDEGRSGRKPKFTAEQVAQIIAVACERPMDESARPVTHWTPRELAAEVVKRGIVDAISPRHIARFFRGGRAEATSVSLLVERKDARPRSRGFREGRRRRL